MVEAHGSLDLEIGAVEIGILISTFLYGIATVQTYIYFRESTRDPRWLRAMVNYSDILVTFITVVTCMFLYRFSVTNFGNYNSLQELPWTLDFSFFIGGLVSATVQSFFAYRVHVISGRWAVSVVAWGGSLVRVGVTLLIFILTFKSGTLGLYEDKYPWSIILSLGVAMFIDVLNTCSLCYYLHRMRTIFKGTNTLIDRVMTWSIGEYHRGFLDNYN
ncbi:hypothetical protein BDZ94DRAFT_1154223 [Collybia nuda]|uniref:Uncharacterized protein n=1 Tax=Collybia nuda TaxID=64659 RepID=A0A9P6CPQ8_9AGAR|nr:hypothetical protein BDZ94DRAFT_1154223 [Collybia nuda]